LFLHPRAFWELYTLLFSSQFPDAPQKYVI
jgi:hypothetical protein